jgi:uncharacterized C2H2 Zn-finger protein
MMPKISAKFRRLKGMPYAIEQFSGKQFRCRHCNQVFGDEKQLDRHLEYVGKTKRSGTVAVDPHAPQLNQMLELKIGYMYDINDCMRRQYLKLKKNEVYDGIIFTKRIKEHGDER